jgi:hypothetical protein
VSRLTFKKAVQETQFLQHAYQAGLQALKENDRELIRCKNTRSLTGSINLDEALKPYYPNKARWDYGIGIARSPQSEEAIWIEVHSASSSEDVKKVLKKLNWLKQWLRESAPLLHQLTEGFYWGTSGSVYITPDSRQAKILAKAGLQGPQRRIEIE